MLSKIGLSMSVLFVFLAIVASPLAAQPGVTEAQIEARLAELYHASTFGDVEAMADLISQSPETVFLGTDPDEVFVGHDAIVAWWQGIFDFLASIGYPNNGGLPLVATGEPLQIQRRGSVAWVVDELLFRFANGDVPARLSVVFVLEQGEWRVAQGHFSIGVPDEGLPL